LYFSDKFRYRIIRMVVGSESSFGFLGLGLCGGKNQMCLNVRWFSLFLQ
jgi:hypothetical protein